MAATGKSTEEVYEWIKKVIESCENVKQLEAADRLTVLFLNKIHRDFKIYPTNLRFKLSKVWYAKFSEVTINCK